MRTGTKVNRPKSRLALTGTIATRPVVDDRLMTTISALRHRIDRGLIDRRVAAVGGRKVTPIVRRVVGEILSFLKERGPEFARVVPPRKPRAYIVPL
jgi:hypothetical protein